MPDHNITIGVEILNLEEVKELRKELERIKELKEEIKELEKEEDEGTDKYPTDPIDIDPDPSPNPRRPKFWLENEEREFKANDKILAGTQFEI